ncbi:MAG: hypothetical protein WD356_07695 [Pseudomonadales bacterium]
MDWGSFFLGWMLGTGLAWYFGHRVIMKAKARIPPEYWPDDLLG